MLAGKSASRACEPQVKKILFPLLIITLLGVGALYWLSDNLDELIAQAITQHGSAMTQARVGVEHVEIHPKSGKGVVSGLVIGNTTWTKSSPTRSPSTAAP
jgi:hypothetical protein